MRTESTQSTSGRAGCSGQDWPALTCLGPNNQWVPNVSEVGKRDPKTHGLRELQICMSIN